MGISPAFNIEVKVSDREEAEELLEGDLAELARELGEEFYGPEPGSSDLYSEIRMGDGDSLLVRFTESHDHHVGNLGNWPAVLVSYAPMYVAEMPDVKHHVEALDEVRDFFAKRKPASDIKYYVTTRTT